MDETQPARDLAKLFITECFAALTEERVIPTSRYNLHVRVGRDYFGDTVRGVPSYAALEEQIASAFPHRFVEPGPGLIQDFPSTYIFSLVEAAVYRCGFEDDFDPTSAPVQQSIDELIAILSTSTTPVAAARIVTHLTTPSSEPTEVGAITVVPADGWDALRYIGEVIPGTGAAVSSDPPFVHAPPGAVIVARTESDLSPFDAARDLSGDIERFLLAVRLLTGTTAQSAIEVQGATSRISRMPPHMIEYLRGGFTDILLRRTARVDKTLGPSIESLLQLLEAAGGNTDGKLISSFAMALRMFTRSHQYAPWFERVVDLSTAMEAALIGQGDDNAGLSLRLRTRAAALLSTDTDPAEAIFSDVRLLYGIRSRLVHGDDVTHKSIDKLVHGLSTIRPDEPAGLALERSVDRLRDLVRRSILARACLGVGADALWPFGPAADIDVRLASDDERARWRSTWHGTLATMGASKAVQPARRAVDAISQEDR